MVHVCEVVHIYTGSKFKLESQLKVRVHTVQSTKRQYESQLPPHLERFCVRKDVQLWALSIACSAIISASVKGIWSPTNRSECKLRSGERFTPD